MRRVATLIAQTVGLTACCLIIATPCFGSAQAGPATPKVPANWELDYDLFQTLLQTRGLRSSNAAVDRVLPNPWDRAFRDPSKSVVILTGSLRSLSSWRPFHRFLTQGGVVLVATNEPVEVRGFFRIEFGPATTRDTRRRWQGYADCLLVTDTKTGPLVDQVSTIVTNRSGWIAHLESTPFYDWSVLARMPGNLQPRSSAYMPLAAMATGRESSGRLIVMADGSPLTNGMLWHGDNLKLLTNLVQELTRDNRTEFAIINGGQPFNSRVPELLVQEAMEQVPEVPPEIPPEALADLPADALLEIGNTLATSIEDSDVLNEVAIDRPRSLADRFYRRSILLTICAAAVAVFVLRSWLNSRTLLPWMRRNRYPEPVEPPASLAAMNFDRAGRALARDTCRFLTDSQEPDDWQAMLKPEGAIWRQLCSQAPVFKTAADTIAQVLSLSAPDSDMKLSQRDFERFGAAIHVLKEHHRPQQSPETPLAWT